MFVSFVSLIPSTYWGASSRSSLSSICDSTNLLQTPPVASPSFACPNSFTRFRITAFCPLLSSTTITTPASVCTLTRLLAVAPSPSPFSHDFHMMLKFFHCSNFCFYCDYNAIHLVTLPPSVEPNLPPLACCFLQPSSVYLRSNLNTFLSAATWHCFPKHFTDSSTLLLYKKVHRSLCFLFHFDVLRSHVLPVWIPSHCTAWLYPGSSSSLACSIRDPLPRLRVLLYSGTASSCTSSPLDYCLLTLPTSFGVPTPGSVVSSCVITHTSSFKAP